MSSSTAEPVSRAGTVAVIGPPNAGKSSLLNHFVGQKLSIVTPAAQTTRQPVRGIDTRGGTQIIFVDTPGLLEPAYLLQEAMREEALASLSGADVILLVLDASAHPPELDLGVIGALLPVNRRILVVLNKVDAAEPRRLAQMESWAANGFDAATFRVSAKTGSGLEQLRAEIVARLPESPHPYPPDDISTQPTRFFVTELIRETIFELYTQEIPYSIIAKVDEFRENSSPVYIRATIFVERDSQRGILIGKGGVAIKRLGERARSKIEDLVGSRVFLDLWVKVMPGWRSDALALERLGFSTPLPARAGCP